MKYNCGSQQDVDASADSLTTIRLQEQTMAAYNSIKRCTRCAQIKDLALFPHRKNGRVDSWCKECCAIYRVDWYERNRDQIKARRGQYNRDYAKRRRQQNPELRLKSIEQIRKWDASLTPENRTRLNQRKKLLKRYGMTIERWEEMLNKQNNACAICGVLNSKDKRNLHVDHCHKTGQVRGLLCVRCNTSLGWFEKQSVHINKIVSYLNGATIAS